MLSFRTAIRLDGASISAITSIGMDLLLDRRVRHVCAVFARSCERKRVVCLRLGRASTSYICSSCPAHMQSRHLPIRWESTACDTSDIQLDHISTPNMLAVARPRGSRTVLETTKAWIICQREHYEMFYLAASTKPGWSQPGWPCRGARLSCPRPHP